MPRIKRSTAYRNCEVCDKIRRIPTLGMCTGCLHKYQDRTSFKHYLHHKFTKIKQRCTNKNGRFYKIYTGKLQITLDQFVNKFINDENALILYKNWQESNFNLKIAPSVDRIDNSGAYTLDNIRILEHGLNSGKDKKQPVEVYKVSNNEYIGTYESFSAAAEASNISYSALIKFFGGKFDQVKGYYFKRG